MRCAGFVCPRPTAHNGGGDSGTACVRTVWRCRAPRGRACVERRERLTDYETAQGCWAARMAMTATVLLALVLTARAADVPYISGGIGTNEREELRAKEHDYNLKVVTAAEAGDYLSGVQLVIESAKNEPVLETTMTGPMLLAKLPPGSYTIKATASGRILPQTVSASRRRD